MRLTLEALGHVLTVTLEQPTHAEPPQPGGDVFAVAERRDTGDHGQRAIGFGREQEDG